MDNSNPHHAQHLLLPIHDGNEPPTAIAEAIVVDLERVRRDREPELPFLGEQELRQLRVMLRHYPRMQAELQQLRDELRETKQALVSGCPQARRVLTDR